MMEIDGSTGEGGGQILRTALALSMCTGQAFALTRIRAGRSKPGLMRQHLSCVTAAADVSGAKVTGAELNSQALQFVPGAVRSGSYAFNVGSAGSCMLVLQTVWPALMMADGASDIALTGGTHNPMAPCFHFLQRSYLPLMQRLGAPASLSLRRQGFYPAGGGIVQARIEAAGQALQPCDVLERGVANQTYAECLAPGLARGIAQRELQELSALLGWQDVRFGASRQQEGPGNALLATLEYEHLTEVFSAFGERGLSAEQVAQHLAAEVNAYLAADGALGPHLADQWVLPLALAVWQQQRPARYSCTELTPHALTNFGTIERFLPVRVRYEAQGSGWMVSVAPAGLGVEPGR